MKILFCRKCNTYTMEESCTNCNVKTYSTKPAKFSPDKKLGKWRRMYKKEANLYK